MNGGGGKDLNLQTAKGADLQSAVITIRQPLQNDREKTF